MVGRDFCDRGGGLIEQSTFRRRRNAGDVILGRSMAGQDEQQHYYFSHDPVVLV